MVEPIQGEAGVKVPPAGYLKKCAEIAKKHNILLMTDEIQTGLGRTGKMFCYQHDGIRPDVVIIGKALAGGVYPVSAILADNAVMNAAFEPGNHGSTFGGNPLACAVASAAMDVLIEEKLIEKSAEMGEYFIGKLREIKSPHVKEIRGKGLLIAVEIKKESGKARKFSEALMREGILAKETHETSIRFAPPLIITKKEIDWAVEKITKVLS
jgi:ornithine--oxo-acid transaminase